MSSYHQEQLQTLQTVRTRLRAVSPAERQRLVDLVADYRTFRAEVAAFHRRYFDQICTTTCFQSRLSACCSREGIITFFADVVINALLSDDPALDTLSVRLEQSNNGYKCVYLGENGCLWRLKPIVCEMFLCDAARQTVFSRHPEAGAAWDDFKRREKRYRWPDRPVLFDELEDYFIGCGLTSPLMYLHNSPGLLRVKERAGR